MVAEPDKREIRVDLAQTLDGIFEPDEVTAVVRHRKYALAQQVLSGEGSESLHR